MLRQTEIPPIQNAVFAIYQMSEDDKIREQARMREKALLVEYLNFKGAREEGRQEGKIEIAANLLNLNMPIDTIVKATGLLEEEILQLANNQ